MRLRMSGPGPFGADAWRGVDLLEVRGFANSGRLRRDDVTQFEAFFGTEAGFHMLNASIAACHLVVDLDENAHMGFPTIELKREVLNLSGSFWSASAEIRLLPCGLWGLRFTTSYVTF